MIFLAVFIHVFLILAMTIAVVCLESDCKKIIFWNLIITITSILGFLVYFVFFCDKPKLKKSIKTKFEEDEVYKNLINFSVAKTSSNNETLNFNKRHYSAEIFKNNNIEVIDNHELFLNTLSSDIEKASNYIIIVNERFLDGINNENIVALLKEKQTMGVDVKYIYGSVSFKNRKILKELRDSGVKLCRFNKFDKFNRYYKNAKDIISVDGDVAYIYSSLQQKSSDKPISCSNLYYKLTGEIVKSVDIDCHLDVTYATRKFYGMQKEEFLADGDIEMQYVSSVADKDFEGLFLKAINDAKKRIVIHVHKFIPTPAIKQALQMAIMSGIDVKIMLSKNNHSINYYSSRAYLKEMAMYGGMAYIYDGMIGSNFIIIDNLTYVGDFSLVNLEIRNNQQNVLIVNNSDFANKTLTYFNEMINNSYRICKPKNVLFKEKIFKKFN
ncbi:MAG: hypothetical protein IJA72_01370 [Clostridia bacterium]|nr:hypothetical protein [Clostridia bacterium]